MKQRDQLDIIDIWAQLNCTIATIDMPQEELLEDKNTLLKKHLIFTQSKLESIVKRIMKENYESKDNTPA